MKIRPGTVSKILWHFTGGPHWDHASNKQSKELKSAKSGYEALQSILHSRKLKVGSYHEIVKVVVDKKNYFDELSSELKILHNTPIEVKSSRVCCVADIPLQHIAYHASRYGKIAIGFHREAILKAGFNPVMYTLEDSQLIKSIYSGYARVDSYEVWDAKNEVESLQEALEDEMTVEVDISDVSDALDNIESQMEEIESSYEDFLAFIKTFDKDEFDSIYCEREWRSIKDFDFEISDVAIIILPRELDEFYFYEDFLSNFQLPRTLTVAAWEDLVEH